MNPLLEGDWRLEKMYWGRGRFDDVAIEARESRVSESRILEGLESDRGLEEWKVENWMGDSLRIW